MSGAVQDPQPSSIGDRDPRLLGAYLRARRSVISPAEVEITPSSRRRVNGLTREEIAVRAGVSVEYYTRLEPGKDRRPSGSVLLALATALNLDPAATSYLAELARVSIETKTLARRDVPDRINYLIAEWSHTPAFVVDRVGNVLWSAPLVAELTPAFEVGKNMFREIFLNPEARKRYVNWFNFTAVLVAGLRATVGGSLHEPEVVDLVTALEAGSPRFAALWQRHDAAPPGGGHTDIRHPTEGIISLNVTNLTITGTSSMLVVYQAQPVRVTLGRLISRFDRT